MTLTNQNQPNVYPGMLRGTGIELFTVESEFKMISDGKTTDFTEFPFNIIQLLEEEIAKDKEVKMALLDWYPNSKYRRIEQFGKCRFGGLDFKADIINHQLQEGEYWDCPVRANCPNNGVICKAPTYNGETLNALDIKLMKLLSTSLTNEVIAEELNIPYGSFHKHKQNLYAKLGNIQTKQENALIAKSLNII